MNDTNIFFWSFIFGTIGFGYLAYGVKQRKGIPLLSGLLLSVVSYVVTNLTLLFLLGVVFMALPILIKRLRG